MKTTLRNWIQALEPKRNRIAQKQRKLLKQMNIVHTDQNNSAFGSKQAWNSPALSYTDAEYSKGLALYSWNQRIS